MAASKLRITRAASARACLARWRTTLHLDAPEGEVLALWPEIERHRDALARAVGRDVGDAVAALDYLTNVRRVLRAPRVVEADALAELTNEAVTDRLTGLCNRRHFERALDREVERARRGGGVVSLLMLDLDGFKAVNDRWGHVAGDRVLQRVAALMRRHLRANDIACRYGGDEFAVILGDAPTELAQTVAERIRAAVRRAFAPKGGRRRPGRGVTVSIGLATAGRDASAVRLLVQADGALYAAKRAGRAHRAGPAAAGGGAGERAPSPLSARAMA